MTLENYYFLNRIFFILAGFVVIGISLWIYFVDRKRKENRLFFLMGLFMAIWITFGYFAHIGQEYSLALIWTKIAAASALLFLIASFFFLIHFLREEKLPKWINNIILFSGLIVVSTTILSNLFFSGMLSTKWGFLPQSGEMWGIYNIFAISMGLLIIFLSLKKYFKLSQEQKFKMQYFLIGFLIFLLMNIIFNTVLPIFYKTYYLYQFGNYSAIIFLGFTAYAIVARELFGIRVILTQALVGVIAILLLWQAVIAPPDWIGFAWKFALFLLFLFFGYLLIQSVIREIQRRAELQRLYDELAKLDEAKTEFITIVSHQLRTPLTAVKGYVSMILEGIYGNFSEKMKRPLENVFASNERLIKFVNDILNVTRIETGKIEFFPEKTQIEEVIDSVIFELNIKAKEKNLYLKWEKPTPSLPKILIDKDKIRQVILNLIDNAIKYTQKGGITVKSEVRKQPSREAQAPAKLEIKISDTGVGMSKEDIRKLFRSFSRGESGVTYYKEGAGIGLYIARQFVEMQGGRIWAESEGEGKGSTFYIELPIK